jgi:arylsulfatase A-like enzyme
MKPLFSFLVYDIAPTILHIFGIPIPEDMDGRVLKEIFENDSELAERSIKYQEIDEKDRIKKRLSELKNQKKL